MNETVNAEPAATSAPAATPAPAPAATPAPASDPTPAPAESQAPAAPEPTQIASGAEPEPAPAATPYWPEDWRNKVADHASGGNDKEKNAVMKSLERINDPSNLFSQYREMQKTMTSGNMMKMPDAQNSEDVQAFYKAMGAPETAEEYYPHIQLQNGAQIGDADKPLVDEFISTVHGAVSPQDFVNRGLNWYYENQEKIASQRDEYDDSYRREAMGELKEEYGDAYQRYTNSISSLFANTYGGGDFENPESLISNLFGGRMADGTVIGNNPHFIRAMVSWAQEINPTATVTGSIEGSSQAVDNELAEIRGLMKTDRNAYMADEQMQARYRELLNAQERGRARA